MFGIAQLAVRGPLYAGGLAALLMFGSLVPVQVLGAFGVFLSMVFLVISSALIALSILRHGSSAGLQALAIGTVILCFVTVATGTGVLQGLLLALMFWVPVAIGAVVLRESVSLDLSLMAITVIALVAVAVVYLVLGDPAESWKALLSAWADQMPGSGVTVPNESGAGSDVTGTGTASVGKGLQGAGGLNTGANGISSIDLSKFVDVMSKMMTGAMAATLFWLACISLLLGRAWQARMFNPGGFQKEFHALRAGKTAAGVGSIVCVGALLMGSGALTSLAAVVISAFFFQGLAVVHALVKSRGMNQGWLIGIYAMLILIQTTILLGALGIADNWLNLRKI